MGRRVLILFMIMFSFFHHTDLSAQGEEKKWVFSGFVETGITWPHNELGVNLRRPDLPETGGFGDNFGRYAVRGQLFLAYRLNKRAVKNIFVIVKPYFVFGRTIPQIEYTWSFRYIGYAKNVGVGVALPRNWKVYLETHRWSFRDKLAVGDGPFELHNMLVVRKDFELSF